MSHVSPRIYNILCSYIHIIHYIYIHIQINKHIYLGISKSFTMGFNVLPVMVIHVAGLRSVWGASICSLVTPAAVDLWHGGMR